MEHSELVAEMAQVEHLSTQDRLHLARMRRAQQLKVAKQKEKEWLKSQSRRDRNANLAGKKQRHITFENSVVVLEAAARNDIEEVGRLLELGVSPDATNEDGLTPLHQCCIDNNADMLRLLLDYGAAVNAKDSEKWTPLHAAATCGHLYLVKILISRGANLLAVNVDGNMPYDLCDDEETLDCIEAEMSRRGVTQELIDETRAATENQMLMDLTDMVARAGDLETPDKHGATPLHIAAANGYSKVVEFLLDHQACVDSVDKDLWTPVHAAACWGHMEVLEMLAMSGADLNARNKNEESPSDICEDAEIRERIEQLKTEQESKRQAEAQRRRVRRSQSNNTRAQSVRRTSLRDKTLTTKKDAVEETRLRLQAQEGYTVPDSTTEPNSIASDVTDAASATARPLTTGGGGVANATKAHNNTSATTTTTITHNLPNGHHLNDNNSPTPQSADTTTTTSTHHTTNSTTTAARLSGSSNGSNGSSRLSSRYPVASSGPSVAYAPQLFDAALSRRSPDGKDNDAYLLADELKLNGGGSGGNGIANNNNNAIVGGGAGGAKLGNENNISAEIFSTSNDNGKINVQVTVLVDTHQLDQSLAGTTLANLKKQRAQSRTSTSSTENGSLINAAGAPTAPTATTAGDGTHRHSGSFNSQGSHNSKHSGTNGRIIGGGVTSATTTTATATSTSTKRATLNGQPIVMKMTTTPLSVGRGVASPVSPLSHESSTPKITKFSGVTSDVVSDSTSRRCCVLM